MFRFCCSRKGERCTAFNIAYARLYKQYVIIKQYVPFSFEIFIEDNEEFCVIDVFLPIALAHIIDISRDKEAIFEAFLDS